MTDYRKKLSIYCIWFYFQKNDNTYIYQKVQKTQ